MYQITLTGDQRIILEMYIRMTTKHRGEEQAACRRLGAELDENGNQKFPGMTSNADWWIKAEEQLQGVLAALGVAKLKEGHDENTGKD